MKLKKIFGGIFSLLFLTLISGLSSSAWADEDFEILSLAPGYQSEFFLTLPFPTAALAFDINGNLYANNANEFNSGKVNIWKINKDLNYAKPYDLYVSYETVMRGVNGLDFDSAGSLFISEFENPCCDPFTETGDAGFIRKVDKQRRVRDPVFFPDFRPTGIATTGKDSLIFPARKWSDASFAELYAVDNFKKKQVSFIGEADWPMTAIAVDRSGNTFVGVPCAGPPCRVLGYNPYTADWMGIATFNKYVEELNFDSEGDLYALEDNEADAGESNADIIKLILPHVVAFGCDTGIVEWPFEDENTITSMIDECAVDAESHGELVSCVAELTNILKKEGIISGQEKGAIQNCVARTNNR